MVLYPMNYSPRTTYSFAKSIKGRNLKSVSERIAMRLSLRQGGVSSRLGSSAAKIRAMIEH